MWGEVVLWAVPGLGACARFATGTRGRRAAWVVVAGACLVIMADKGLDMQTVLYHRGQEWVQRLDPELRLRGPHAWMRWALLGALVTGGTLGLVLLVRRDQALAGGKLLALAGLVAVMGYLGARLVPGLRHHLDGAVGLSIEFACWLIIAVGIVRGGPDGTSTD
jgi:hypothetical protein